MTALRAVLADSDVPHGDIVVRLDALLDSPLVSYGAIR